MKRKETVYPHVLEEKSLKNELTKTVISASSTT